MANPILLLRLEGPLQSWGIRSRWDVRDTSTEPTKSGVVGLLGCALGYGVGDERLRTELDAGLTFGVRVENAGRVVRDYHTVTDFLPTAKGSFKHGGGTGSSLQRLLESDEAEPATIVSQRFYLEDAAFLVALREADSHPGLVHRCAAALQDPVWPIYLGRKACVPTRPVFDAVSDLYPSLEEALRAYPWSWLSAANKLRSFPVHALHGYVEDRDGPLTRQDAVHLNAVRSYGFRSVRQISDIKEPLPAGDTKGAGA